MATGPRLRLADIEFEGEDEELPHYSEPNTAPVYEDGEFEQPLVIYHLRSLNRKLQILVPFGPSSTLSYKIVSSPTFRLFSKKPDFKLRRLVQEENSEKTVASIHFDDDAPLPWRPRAYFSHVDTQGTETHRLEAKNFSDWIITLSDVSYIWRLEDRPMAPISLVFGEMGSTIVIARFTYSGRGTMATNGAEVGELVIYRDSLSMDRRGIEMMVCGLLVAIAHFKRMGRHYGNDRRIRSASLAEPLSTTRRSSGASHANL